MSLLKKKIERNASCHFKWHMNHSKTLKRGLHLWGHDQRFVQDKSSVTVLFHTLKSYNFKQKHARDTNLCRQTDRQTDSTITKCFPLRKVKKPSDMAQFLHQRGLQMYSGLNNMESVKLRTHSCTAIWKAGLRWIGSFVSLFIQLFVLTSSLFTVPNVLRLCSNHST